MYVMSYNTVSMGTAEFRQDVSEPKLSHLLAEHPVVRVGRYRDRPVAVVVSPETFDEMLRDHETVEQLRAFVPLLAAAISTGAVLPSQTLEQLGLELNDDTWQTLNEIQRLLPVRLAQDPEGSPIARTTLRAMPYVDELDEELELLDD